MVYQCIRLMYSYYIHVIEIFLNRTFPPFKNYTPKVLPRILELCLVYSDHTYTYKYTITVDRARLGRTAIVDIVITFLIITTL